MNKLPPANPTHSGIEEGDRLSPREAECMDLLVQGMTNDEIGTAMGISNRGAESHIINIMFKTGIGRRVLLAIWWHDVSPTYQVQQRRSPVRTQRENANSRGSRAITG